MVAAPADSTPDPSASFMDTASDIAVATASAAATSAVDTTAVPASAEPTPAPAASAAPASAPAVMFAAPAASQQAPLADTSPPTTPRRRPRVAAAAATAGAEPIDTPPKHHLAVGHHMPRCPAANVDIRPHLPDFGMEVVCGRLPRPPDETTIGGEYHTLLKGDTRLSLSGDSNSSVGSSTPMAAPAEVAAAPVAADPTPLAASPVADSLATKAEAAAEPDFHLLGAVGSSTPLGAPAAEATAAPAAVGMTPLAFSAHTFPAPSGDAWALAAAAPVLDSLGKQGEVISRVPRTSGSSTLCALEAEALASLPTDGRTTTPGADLSPVLIRLFSDPLRLGQLPPEIKADCIDVLCVVGHCLPQEVVDTALDALLGPAVALTAKRSGKKGNM